MDLRRLLILGLMLVLLTGGQAAAHGGEYIIDTASATHRVVVSLAPAPISVGLGDFSIAVLDPETYQPRPADRVEIVISGPNEITQRYDTFPEYDPELAIYANHEVDFAIQGPWQVEVIVTDGEVSDSFLTTIQVAGSGVRWLSTAMYFVPLLVLGALVGLATLRNRLSPPTREEAPL